MFLTCSLKLRKPTSRKQEIIDNLFSIATSEKKRLSDHVFGNMKSILAELSEAGVNKPMARHILSFLPDVKLMAKQLPSSVKDGVRLEVASAFCSYVGLERAGLNPSLPQFTLDESDEQLAYEKALADLCAIPPLYDENDSGKDIEIEQALTAQLQSTIKPPATTITLTRAREIGLVRKASNGALYLFLSTGKDGEKCVGADNQFVNITDGKVFNTSRKKGILLPVNLRSDSWIETKFFATIASETRQAKIRSAKLFMRDGNYYLNVSVEFVDAPLYEPETLLGIDRGVFYEMAYAITDLDGRAIALGCYGSPLREEHVRRRKLIKNRQQRGQKVSRKLYGKRGLDKYLHEAANRIVITAASFKSMIVLEDLGGLKVRGSFYTSCFAKMAQIVIYKAQQLGVPVYQKKTRSGIVYGVLPHRTSQLCIECGEINKSRKRDGSPFNCPSCGVVYHADSGAGVNISRRSLYRKKDWLKSGGLKGFDASFANMGNFLTETDLRESVKGGIVVASRCAEQAADVALRSAKDQWRNLFHQWWTYQPHCFNEEHA